ncbi:MAG: hypothetical protein V4525_15105 [Pseudomonadota bacterium]
MGDLTLMPLLMPLNDIKQAWERRSADLCRSKHYDYYVELKYPYEPLNSSEKNNFFAEKDNSHAIYAGFVYIPIIVPSSTVNRPIDLQTATKLASIRCIKSPDVLENQSRAVSITDKKI